MSRKFCLLLLKCILQVSAEPDGQTMLKRRLPLSIKEVDPRPAKIQDCHCLINTGGNEEHILGPKEDQKKKRNYTAYKMLENTEAKRNRCSILHWLQV